MSYLQEISIQEAIPILKKMYTSFGLRSLILFKNDEWINVTTVINFTCRSIEDLEKEYRTIQNRMGKIDLDYLKIVFLSKPIDAIDKVIEELKSGYLMIGDLKTKLLTTHIDLTTKFVHYSYNLKAGEYIEYDCYTAMLSMNNNAQTFLQGISPSKLYVPDFGDLFRSWLELENSQMAINVFFVVPTYAKIILIKYVGGNEISSILKVHDRLLDNSALIVLKKGFGDMGPILERKEYSLRSFEESIQENFAYITIPHKFSGLDSLDSIQIQIVHSDLGLLDDEKISMRDFLPQTVDSFSQAFSLFDAGKKIEDHLFNPKSSVEFEAAISWLLELTGIMTIRLNKTLKGDETIREDLIVRGSADILAYNSFRKQLAVIDCTTGIPSEIDRIRNTAGYISRKLSTQINAIIISSVEAPVLKEKAKEYGIKVIDKLDLEKTLTEFKKGIRSFNLG